MNILSTLLAAPLHDAAADMGEVNALCNSRQKKYDAKF